MDTVSSARVGLADGTQMPVLGLGVYKVDNDVVESLVSHVLSVGYRLIDTASMYENEEGVGSALAASAPNRTSMSNHGGLGKSSRPMGWFARLVSVMSTQSSSIALQRTQVSDP